MITLSNIQISEGLLNNGDFRTLDQDKT